MLLRDLISKAERIVTQGQGSVEEGVADSNSPKWVLIRSNLLGGEHILLVLDRECIDEAQRSEPGKVIYFPSEVEELHKHKDKSQYIEKIHMLKKKFDGLIVPEDSFLVRRLKRFGLWE